MSRKRKVTSDFVSPYISSFPFAVKTDEPQALERDISTLHQINTLEKTLVWGQWDNLPMLILKAIEESPTTTSCLGTVEMFTRGGGFTDPELGKMVIDKDGTTLDAFHAQLVSNLVKLRSFSVNFQFDGQRKITNSYYMGTETNRFKAPIEGSKTIDFIKHNPYWGTKEYNQNFTCEYPLWNPTTLPEQIKKLGTKFPGQVFYYGEVRAPFKFYPVPKFWSGEKWIYSDAKIAIYVDELLGNGFFSSVMMQVVGDPTQWSKNPRLQREVTGMDGTKRKEPTHTVGEEFNEQMSKNFSGVKKAGTAFVKWVNNKNDVVDLQAFPTTATFDFVDGIALDIIRFITIATQVPAILANLPASLSSLASGGDAVRNAIELMQSNTLSDRVLLENFYNNVMFPNLQKPIKIKAKIKNFIPVTTQVTVDKNIWDFLNEAEKIEFVTNNVPNVKIIRPAVAAPVAPLNPDGTPAPVEPAQSTVNEALKSLKASEINRLSTIVGKFAKGQLTLEQAKQLMASYGFSEEQIAAWLPTNGVLV